MQTGKGGYHGVVPAGLKNIETILVGSGDRFPNNDRLPLLIYRQVFLFETNHPAMELEQLFSKNGWHKIWHSGIYGVDHYHSCAHEALGVASGEAEVQFGGEDGPIRKIEAGDVLLVPAGVTHRRLSATRDTLVVGCYPPDQEPDICYGYPEDRLSDEAHIAEVPFPEKDPVTGESEPLASLWSR